MTIRYSTAGTNNDVYVETTIEMGNSAENPCPPTGSWSPLWVYDAGSRVCIDDAETVTVTV
jgi:hypothetical protein